MPKVGVLTIDVDSGTAAFLADMDRANAKLAQFGQTGQQSGIHLVSSMQSSSAAIRLLENPLGNNIRAVERFISLLPGMGRLLQAAFPVVGALAFGSILVKMGSEAVAFYQKIEQAPVRIAAAFRELNEPIKLSNDELALANERLTADIAKLEGKPQTNGGAIALDEMRVNADRLAESLDKDLGALQKLVREESVGFFQSLLTGSRSTSGDDQGISRFREQLASAMRRGNESIRNAKTPEEARGAEAARNLEIQKLYTGELDRQNALIREAVALQKDRDQRKGGFAVPGQGAPKGAIPSDQSNFIATHRDTVDRLQSELDTVNLLTQNASLEGQKATAEAQHQAQELQKKGAAALLRIQEEVIRAQREAYAKLQEDQKRASDYEAKTFEQRLAKQNAFLESEIEYYDILRRIDEEGWRDQERRSKEQDEEAKKNIASVPLQQRLNPPTQITLGSQSFDFPRINPPGQTQSAISAAMQVPENAGLQADHIAQLQKELGLARETNQPIQEQLKLRQQILQLQIAQAAAQSRTDATDKIASANVALQQTLAQWRSLDIGNVYQDFEAALAKLPEALGNSLASSIFDKPKRGETKGQEVEKGVVHTFEGAGKNLTGQLISQSIEKLIAKMVGQAVFASAQVTATTANTAAIVANTAAMTGTAVAGAAGGAGGAGGFLKTAFGWVKGLLGFAEGGRPAPGLPYVVGENGPELRVDDGPGTIFSNRAASAYLRSFPGPTAQRSGMTQYGNHTFHIYEASDPRQTAREVANHISTTGPGYTVFSK